MPEEFDSVRLESIRYLIFGIAHALSEDKEKVQLAVSTSGSDATLFLRVSTGDLEKFNRHDGRAARSIGTILQAVSRRDGHRYLLEIGVAPSETSPVPGVS